MTILTIIVSVFIMGTAFFFGYGRENTWRLIAGNPDQGPFELTQIQRNSRPNDALLCTDNHYEGEAKIDKALPSYALSPAAIINRLDEKIQQSGMKYGRVDDYSDPAGARYVIWSDLMRFPDTIQFQAMPLQNGETSLIAYGCAQLGYSDNGMNFKRLDNLTKAIQ